jgi:hypothetical protein
MVTLAKPSKILADIVSRVRAAVPQLRPRRPKRRGPVIQPYVDLRRPTRLMMVISFPVILAAVCLVYGFFFALTAPYLMVPFAAPIALLALLSIWALPDRAYAPTRSMEFFFYALIIALVLWPNYLALALPGLPWITMLRLTGFPMAFFFLVCLSTSPQFRREIRDTLEASPGLLPCLGIFILTQFATIVLAKSPPEAFQRALLQQINWTAVLLIAAWVCRVPGRVARLIGILLLLAVPIMMITLIEAQVQHVLWAGNVPAFLKVDDPVAALILSATTRSATGLYRAKATFSTPLGLAEYLALLTPFLIHFSVGRYPLLLKIASISSLPLLFYCIRLTDARLGTVGFLLSFVLYILYWGLLRLRRNKSDLIAAATVYAYPAIFCAFGLAVMTIRRLHVMVFGDGAQAASNAARQTQLLMGIPKILVNPFGYGPGGSGRAMGYGEGEFITIDNFYLSIALDSGVVGLVTFVAIFMVVIYYASQTSLDASQSEDREAVYAIPIVISLSAFLVIKGVFSQVDNHPIVYVMTGMAAGLVWRARQIPAGDAAPTNRLAEAQRQRQSAVMARARRRLGAIPRR